MGNDRESGPLASEARIANLRAGFVASFPRRMRSLRETMRVIETSTNEGIRGRALIQFEETLQDLESGAQTHGFEEVATRSRALTLRYRQRLAAHNFVGISSWPEATTLMDEMTRLIESLQ